MRCSVNPGGPRRVQELDGVPGGGGFKVRLWLLAGVGEDSQSGVRNDAERRKL